VNTNANRQSPFPSLTVLLRVVAKAVVLLLIVNVVCLATNVNPVRAVTLFNTWWLVGHGRARLAYPSDFQNGQLPVESLLAAHAIAYTPKAADEFRVIVLGESGIAGWGLADQDTFAGQLTARGVQLNGKRVVAYNLAYPSPSAVRDVLILDAALRYQPDLVIWFTTAAALDDSPEAVGVNGVFFDLNRQRLTRIAQARGLQSWLEPRLSPEPQWRNWLAIRDQDTLPVWINALLYPFVAPDLGLTTRRIASEPIPAKAKYYTGKPGFESLPNQTWQFLIVGRDLAAQAGARLLLVNEPMLIGTGKNSDVNYNLEYERVFYDAYRDKLAAFAATNQLWYADRWDVIPAAHFTDTPFHADAGGYALLVDQIVEQILTVHQ